MKNQANSPPIGATFFFLLSLSPSPQYGYAIMEEVEVLSKGGINFSTGMLYGAIRRLLEQGGIKRVADLEPNPADRERKNYTLTNKGRKVVNAEVEHLRPLLITAEQCTSESASWAFLHDLSSPCIHEH